MHHSYKLSFPLILYVCTVFLLLGCEKKVHQYKIDGETMGTRYHVIIPQTDEKQFLVHALKEKIDKTLQEVNQSLSTYIPDSEISRFNQFNETNTWMNISEHMFNVSQKAQEIHVLTDYYFDPSIAPLINLWGFGYKDHVGVPQKSEIEALLPLVGMNKIEVGQNIVYQIKKNVAELELDFSAIAKGYGVDQVSFLLIALGYHHHFVEIGGEIVVKGFRDGKKQPWKVAIETPQTDHVKKEIFKTLELSNIAMATSGDYRNFFNHEGKTYNHNLVPSTGYPSQHSTRSVTVLHKNCVDADAFATGLLAMGYPEAFTLANNLGLSALFIVEQKDKRLKAYTSNSLVDLQRKTR